MIEYILFFIIFVMLLTVVTTFLVRCGEKYLRAWAKKNNLQIISCKYHHVMIGPFRKQLFFTGKGGYLVYKFQAEAPHGDIKTGYAIIGNYFLSLFSDKVDVIWVDQSVK